MLDALNSWYLHSPLTQQGRGDIVYALKLFFQRTGLSEPVLKLNWIWLMLFIVFAGGGIAGLLASIFGISL